MMVLPYRAINAGLSSFMLLSVVVFRLFSKTDRKRKYKLNVEEERVCWKLDLLARLTYK